MAEMEEGAKKREEEPINCYRAGFLAFNSRATMSVFLQNVAANGETRQKFVDSHSLKFLVPLMLFESKIKGGEPSIIQWATESNMVDLRRTIVETGSELNKCGNSNFPYEQIAMHILEAILQDEFVMSFVCTPICDHLLKGLMKHGTNRWYIILCKRDRGCHCDEQFPRCYDKWLLS
ncbi:uncharacterized protein [Elaeis guineensis]|uniref:uncharacterized protein isoform X3 n=1 Tax=Elaeis guineensis var. tenera TaxID=51953 RepID=UPI003C6CF56B